MSDPEAEGWLRHRTEELVLAFALLTRLPLPRLAIRPDVAVTDYIWAFPVVGFAVGHIAAAALLLGQFAGLSNGLAALAAMAVSMLATGALHEDGLADFSDGIGGGRTRERKLEIMHDSSIGSFGAVALFLVLAARWSALSSMSDVHAAAGILVLSHTFSRGLLGVIPEYWRPARGDGLAATAAKGNVVSSLAAVALSLTVGLAVDGGIFAVAAFLAATAGILCVMATASRYLGGYTGDVFGAAEQIAEVAVLVVCATLLSH